MQNQIDPMITTSGFLLVPTKYGPMISNPLDKYIGRALCTYGEYSDDEVSFLCSVVPEGGVAWDIGANLGAITLPLAKKVGEHGTILALEPQRLIYNALCGTLALNGVYHVHAILGAAGMQSGQIMVPTLHPVQALNFGGMSLLEPHLEAGEGEARPIYRLDDVQGFKRLDLIKIDVEGMENEVLFGATETIEKFRPLLYVEDDRKERSPELHERLTDMGYYFIWHSTPLFNPRNHNRVHDNFYENIFTRNLFCVPKERREEFEKSQNITQWLNQPGGHDD